MLEPQEVVTSSDIRSGAVGAGTATTLCLLLLVVSKWSRWRGKRIKQLPEPPTAYFSVKRGWHGRFKLEFERTL